VRSEDFTKSAPGRLVEIPEGGQAFIPDPLPPRLPEPTLALMNAQVKAALAIGRLEQMLLHSDLDTLMVVYSLIRREAVLSSAMEGTVTSPEQLALFDASVARGVPQGDASTREVWNAYNAMNMAVANVRDAEGKRLTTYHLRGAHKVLMQGLPGVIGTPGEYRRLQNHIGGATLEEARFVPPPCSEVPHLMDDLVRFSNLIGPDSDPPQLVGLALQHYQFETIHPFPDGNGRLGRFLTTLTMTARGLTPHPLLYVSAWLHRHKKEYCERMLAVSQRGEWAPWLLFFVQALEHSANEAVAVADRLVALRRSYRERTKPVLWPVIELLFRSWVITIGEVAKATVKTDAQAGQYLRKLAEKGIVREVSGGKKNLRYLSDEILDVAFRASPAKPFTA